MTKQAAQWYSIRKHSAVTAAVLALAAGSTVAAGTAPPAASAEILIYGDIGDSWWAESVSACNFVRELQALDVEAITVRINSIGGSVPDGIAIYNAMRRHKASITTIVDGMALSVASLIACAGNTVQMAENATWMVHAPGTYAEGNAVELREMAAQLDVWAAAMSTSYAAKTGMSAADALALVSDGKDHWYTAAEAKAEGFVDEVISAAPVTAMASGYASRLGTAPAHVKALFISTHPPVAAATNPLENSVTQATNPTPADIQAAAAATAAAATAQAAAVQQGVQAEALRRTHIRASFQPWAGNAKATAYLKTAEDDVTVTAAAAKEQLLTILASDAKAATPTGNAIETVADERDKIVAAHVEVILARAGIIGPKGRIVASEGNPYRGLRLSEMARASLHRAGYKTDGMDQMKMVGAAFKPISASGVFQGTTDFPILLENALHKVVQMAYIVAPDTWSKWAKRGTVSDFRAHPRYRVGSLTNLDLVNEGGEFKFKSIPDGEKASLTAVTKGNLISLTRQAIINDDMQVFTDIGTSAGRAAKRTVEADAYALLVSNPVLNDGIALFHASHGNLPTAAAPSVTAFDAARVGMATQKDVGGNDFLDLVPAIWLGPKSLGGLARVINSSEYDPDTANKLQRKNMVMNLFADIVDTPRLSGTGWYTFANPNEAPVLEVAFLDGNDTPFLDLQNSFEVDGATYKVRLDFAVGAIDYRGAQLNTGA